MIRRNFVRCLIALFALAVLAGCASSPRVVSESEGNRIRNIGVVSVIAREFHRGYTGLTVFGNEYEKLDITSWNVDAEYEQQIVEALREIAKTGKIVSVDRKAFLPAQLPSGPYEAPAFNAPRWSAVEDATKRYAAEHDVDAVIVVVRRISGDFLAGTNQTFRGVGYYARGFGDLTRVSVLHGLGYIGLLDGKTGKPLAVTTLHVVEPVAADLARRKFGSPDSPEHEADRQRIVRLPRGYWERSIRDIFGK